MNFVNFFEEDNWFEAFLLSVDTAVRRLSDLESQYFRVSNTQLQHEVAQERALMLCLRTACSLWRSGANMWHVYLQLQATLDAQLDKTGVDS